MTTSMEQAYEFVRISHHWGRSAKVDGARSSPT